MSRIGKQPIVVPSGIQIKIQGNLVTISGQKGAMTQTLPKGISAVLEDNALKLARSDDSHGQKALHGLTRSLINNMVIGLTKGFTKQLEVIGVGYKTKLEDKKLIINVGYSHPLVFEVPAGIEIIVDVKNNVITINGYDKQLVGELAAEIRMSAPPEPYKGKGIKYTDERIRRKAGKALGK
jgi:large subunit ribosomal protein L6